MHVLELCGSKNAKIKCYLKDPNSSNCKLIREAMCAYIERENIKLGGSTLYVVEEKPVKRQEQQKTFGKALDVAEYYAKNSGEHISSERQAILAQGSSHFGSSYGSIAREPLFCRCA